MQLQTQNFRNFNVSYQYSKSNNHLIYLNTRKDLVEVEQLAYFYI